MKLAFLYKANLALLESKTGLAGILHNLTFNPEEATNFFLPGMPHDVLYETIQLMIKQIDRNNAITPKFFLCPNNHLYTIGDCTRPSGKGNCRDSGAVIGALSYWVLLADNKALGNRQEETQLGYIQQQLQTKDGIRFMTPFETSVSRLIVHICLYAAS